MNATETYIKERDEQVRRNMDDRDLRMMVERVIPNLVTTNYTKNFTWMGIPILQYPSDLMVMQELIFKIKPDVIIETGIAFGGMTRFYADMLDLIHPFSIYAKVIAIDIDIRKHTRDVLGDDDRVDLIEGSSISPKVIAKVRESIAVYPDDTVLVSLDSNHTHAHVLREIELYAPLVTVGSYVIVFDTAIEMYGNLDKNKDHRPWGPGNSPYTAVQEFLGTDLGKCFEVDREIEARALITAAIGGFLRRIK